METTCLNKQTAVTQLLSNIGIKARSNSYMYWDHFEYAMHDCRCMDEKWGFIWFRTSGCINERQGSCMYCKYGTGHYFKDEEIMESIDNGLRCITDTYDFMFASSSGSILDEREVSEKVFNHYLDELSITEHKSFGFETRCETISSEVIKKTQKKLNGRLRFVYMGLEVANESILKYCLNKQQKLKDYKNAITILSNENIGVCTNILVGIPFYSIDERIKLAIKSIKWSFSNGTSKVFLFPINVKDNTPLAVLFKANLYSPPSLWELIEIIKSFPDEIENKKIGISWYKPQKGANGIIHSPGTCEKCNKDVLSILEEYDQNPKFFTVQRLLDINCSCKQTWLENKKKSKNFSVDSLIYAYEFLAGQWEQTKNYYHNNAEEIINEILSFEHQLKEL